MTILKFGETSINSVEGIQNIPAVLQQYANKNLMLIIPATSKTTHDLEKIAEAFYAKKTNEALHLFNNVKQQHTQLAGKILKNNLTECLQKLNDFFTEVEWLLYDKPVRGFNYYYDQIVCIGEILNSYIVSCFLNENNFKHIWLDARDIIKTDNNFKQATINFNETTARIKNTVKPAQSYVTQGFTGCTDENESATFGNKGDNYVTDFLANILQAEIVII